MAKRTSYELQVKLGAKTSASWKTVLKKAEQDLKGLNSVSNAVIAGTAAGVTTAAASATYALSQAESTYKGFQQEMATVKSISGATVSQFEAMKEAALDAGLSPTFSAEEAGSALEYMSLAGWSAEDSITGLIPILKTAAATEKELETTSDLVTDSMSALKIGVSDLDMYLDKVIESNNDANTSAEQLMQALVKAGGASRTLGADLDDTITALDILANNGKKGEEAGTALNAIFVRLAGNATAIKELGNLGVDIWDDSGNFIGLEETLIAINNAMSKLTDEEKAQSLKNVAGTHYYSQMAYLLDAVTEVTDAEGNISTAWDTLEGQIENSSGALDKMYSTTMDTLDNAEKRVQSAAEDMQIRVVDVFADDEKEFFNWLADELPDVTDSIVAFAEAHQGEFADALEWVGGKIEFFWEEGVAAGQWIIQNRSAIVGGIKGIAGGIALVKAATTGLKIAELFANPLSAAGTTLAIAAVGIGSVAGAIDDAERAATEANLAEHFGGITLSMDELDSVAKQLIGEDLIYIAETLESAMSETDSAFSELNSLWSTLQKDEWKLEMGFNFDPEDYQSEIESYVKQAQQYVEDKGYAVHVATTMLLGKNSKIDLENSEYYSQLETELGTLQLRLQKSLKSALDDDGIIDIDEEAVIQKYLESIQKITEGISEAQNQAQLDAISLKYSLTDLDADSFIQLEQDLQDYNNQVADSALDAYQTSMAALRTRLNNDETFTQDDFDTQEKKLKEAYQKTIADSQLDSTQYLVDSIFETYGDEIDQYNESVSKAIEYYGSLGNAWDEEGQQQDLWQSLKEMIDENGPDLDTQMAIAELLGNAQDGIQALYDLDLASLDDDTKKKVADIMERIELLQEVANYGTVEGTDARDRGIANRVEEYDSYDYLENYVENRDYDNKTYDIGSAQYKASSENIQAAIEEGSRQIAEDTYNSTTAYLESYFTDMGIDFDVVMHPNIQTEEPTTSGKTYEATISKGIDASDLISEKLLMHNAEGGIYDRPILTTFAEEGPEAAVPLDGSQRAKSLWLEAGERLGMIQEGSKIERMLQTLSGSTGESRDERLLRAISGSDSTSGTGDTTIQVNYNPNVVINGNTSSEEVRQGLTLGLEDLKEMLKEIQRENSRVSFV